MCKKFLENQIKRIESQLSMPTVRFSQFDKYTDQKVLLLDSIGHLMNAYSLATVAYVGGGFTGKLHNILEPIAFKVPVLFGPKHEKFPEASHFLQAGIGFEIKDGEELKEKFGSIVSDEFEIKKSIETFLSKQANISSQLYEHIEN